MQRNPAPPFVPTGRINTFGPVGPKYEVGEAVEPLDNGDWLVEVTLLESGETARYPLTGVFDDPEAK